MNSKWRGVRIISGGLLAVVLAFSLAGSVGKVSAGWTIFVTTTADDLAINGNCSLREAIQAANLDTKVDACHTGSGSDMIQLSTGTYENTIIGSNEDNNLTGDLDIQSDITIVGAGISKTFVDGGSITDRTFHIHPGARVTMSDLTIIHGSAQVLNPDPNIPGSGEGGGVFNRGSVTLLRVGVRDNIAGIYPNARGNGISNRGNMTIRQSVIGQNECDFDCDGMGIYNHQGAELEIEYTTMSDTAGSYNLFVNEGWTRMVGVDMSRNTYRYNVIVNHGYLEISSSLFKDNQTNEYGASLFESTGNESELVIRDTLFKDNLIQQSDHLFELGGSVSMERATFLRNTGDISVEGSMTIQNSTISGHELNEMDWLENNYGTLQVQSGANLEMDCTTMAYNYTQYAIQSDGGEIALHNSLLSHTFDLSGGRKPDCFFTNLPHGPSLGYNLISVKDSCGWVNATGDQGGTLVEPLDAKLGSIVQYSVVVYAHPLLAGSPAIDKGNPYFYPPTDQRLEVRPQDGDGDGIKQCDVGSFEVDSTQPTLTPRMFIPGVMR